MCDWDKILTVVQYQWHLGHFWSLDLYVVHHKDFGWCGPQGVRTCASELVQGREFAARTHIAMLRQRVNWVPRPRGFKGLTKGIASNPLLASLYTTASSAVTPPT